MFSVFSRSLGGHLSCGGLRRTFSSAKGGSAAQALLGLRRLAKFHSGELQPHLQEVCTLCGPAVLALRSNTSRMCMVLVQVEATAYKKSRASEQWPCTLVLLAADCRGHAVGFARVHWIQLICKKHAQELSCKFERLLDGGVTALLPPLAQRLGEVSRAGRKTFVAAAADATISCLMRNLSPLKASRGPC